VFLNGIRLVPSTDYVLSGGNTITFTNPLQNGDVVFAQVFTKLTVAQEALLDQKVIDAQTQVSLATAQVALATTQATNSLNSANASEASRLASESARDLSQTYRDNSQTYATNSANSATASANSATAAANSATSAQNSLDTFNDKFIASASAPSSPSDGDLWYDTVNVRLKIYIAGSGWQNAGAYLEGLISRYTYTATSGQTVFSVSDNSSVLNFTAEANVFVFLNGVRLTPISDYTLSGTNTCTLPSGVQVGDILYIEVITKISLTEEAILQGYVANALSSKTDAETAKTQAETAETNAETAETNAVAAKNASESARDLAEQYRDTASNHATTATTQVGIATTKASEAVVSASQAAASAVQAAQSAGGGTVKITPNDTTADNLANKVVGGNGITVSVLNGSGNEDLNFALSMTESNTTPTSGQTDFSVTYTVGFIQVFLNGIKLINGTDFTATNGTSVVLASGATTSDVIEFVVWA
jgi:trimeric autotransporter adhesin